MTDLVSMVELYKKDAETYADLFSSITKKIIELNKDSRKNDKLAKFKKMELVRKIANEYNKTHPKE